MIFERFANLKYKYGHRHFWAEGYYVSAVRLNKKAIETYIKNQMHEGMITDQMTLKEYANPLKDKQ